MTARNRKTISQREARALKREVELLRAVEDHRRNAWARKYPGGVNIASLAYGSDQDFIPAVVHNSRRLGHAVVVTTDGATVMFYALPLPEKSA